MKNRLLRALADMENLRKRTEREVADARQYGIASFARDILGVADNFRRALECDRARTAEQRGAGASPSLIEGVELTERESAEGAREERHPQDRADGREIRSEPASGDVRGARSSVPSGSVVQVIQPGYVIGDRILRPAMVAIAKGGPKIAAAAARAGNDNADAKLTSAPPDSTARRRRRELRESG